MQIGTPPLPGQAGDSSAEIEVTPAMIAAGVDVLLRFSVDLDSPSETVARILRAVFAGRVVRLPQTYTGGL